MPIENLVPALLVSFTVAALFTVALRPVAITMGLVDRPGGRKAHVGEVPLVGGVAMFLAIAVSIQLVPALSGDFFYMLLAGALLLVVGLIDDRYGLAAGVRVVAQLLAVLIMVYGADLLMRDIGNPLFIGTIETGPLALVATAVMFITTINAYNLIDGIDGLAGSMLILAFAAVAVVSSGSGDVQAVAVIGIAAVLGFGIFNVSDIRQGRYRAFMGDSGSVFLGFLVVWLVVSICQGPAREISPVTGLWFAALPLFDLLTCFVRRVVNRTSPFEPNDDHAHHSLKRAGFGNRKTLLILTGIQTSYAAIGIIGHFARIPEPVMFSLWSIAGVSQFWMIRSIGRLHRPVPLKQDSIRP